MPWPSKQRTAIFLDVKRRKGERAARAMMHAHGHREAGDGELRRRRIRKQALDKVAGE